MAELFFRPGTWDAEIWHSVAGPSNEYGLPTAMPPGTTVIDIGGHIGAFSYAVLDRGADFVLAVEPDPANAHLWQHNLHQACQAMHRSILLTAACWRSDQCGARLRLAHVGPNTGGVHVMAPNGPPVRAVGLDAVIELAGSIAGRVRLLKLDCEGAEWPILMTAGRLAQVDEIIGEYHPCPASAWDGPSGPDSLGGLLSTQGFQFTHQSTDDRGLGLFHAWRGEPMIAAKALDSGS